MIEVSTCPELLDSNRDVFLQLTEGIISSDLWRLRDVLVYRNQKLEVEF